MNACLNAGKEEEASRRMERLKRVKKKQDPNQERVKPDTFLQHRPGQWQRMENEAESARRMERQRNVTLKKDKF